MGRGKSRRRKGRRWEARGGERGEKERGGGRERREQDITQKSQILQSGRRRVSTLARKRMAYFIDIAGWEGGEGGDGASGERGEDGGRGERVRGGAWVRDAEGEARQG